MACIIKDLLRINSKTKRGMGSLITKNQRQKVLFITNFCPHYHKRPFEELSRRYDVTFIFTSKGKEYHGGKNTLVDLPFKYSFIVPSILRPIRIAFEVLFGRYDVIIKCPTGGYIVIYTYLLARMSGVKFVFWSNIWHYGRSARQRVAKKIHFFLYRHSDVIVTYGFHINKFIAQNVTTRKPLKIFESFNVVDNTLFDRPVAPTDIEKIRKDQNINSKYIIMYVGRLMPAKGVEYLLQAFYAIENLFDVTLVLIGDGISIVPDSKKVRCINHLPNEELYKYYNLADIFVLPSITTDNFKEAWGLVINEAMNCGTAIVATDAVGAASGGLIEDSVNGFIVPERNAIELAKKISILLSDQSLLEGFKVANKNKVKIFDEKLFADGFEKAITAVIDSR